MACERVAFGLVAVLLGAPAGRGKAGALARGLSWVIGVPLGRAAPITMLATVVLTVAASVSLLIMTPVSYKPNVLAPNGAISAASTSSS